MTDGPNANSPAKGVMKPEEAFPPSLTRIAVVINSVTPYMRPLWARLGERSDIDLLLVTETPKERDRKWEVETDLPVEHVQLDSWTLDLSWMAVGSGFKTRFDSYLYVPKRPLVPLRRFAPHVVVAAGGGVWSSPANIAALVARHSHGWAVVPWWNTFTRERRSLPRRVAEPWVRYFFRSGDAWLAGGSRHARDVVRLGADPNRTVIAPLTALGPDPPLERDGFFTSGQPRFLFVGRFIERKGIDVLLSAFRRVDRGELWLAGDGPLRSLVEGEVKRDPRIRFLGYADEESLPELYRQADVLVVPSLFEPWGLVVHEGLAYGLPVIATDQVAAADDLVESGVNGYVVAAGSSEALASAMRSVSEWGPSHWQEAAMHSRETLPLYGIDRAADAFVEGCLLGLRHRRSRSAPSRASRGESRRSAIR
jgi:glycosyltransferase involved in cell wall biosynthesis